MIINNLGSINHQIQNNSNRKQSFGIVLYNKKAPQLLGDAFEDSLTKMVKTARKVVVNGKEQEVEAIFNGKKRFWSRHDKVSLTVVKKAESVTGVFNAIVKGAKKLLSPKTKGESEILLDKWVAPEYKDNALTVSNLFERGIHDYVKKAEKKAGKLAQ